MSDAYSGILYLLSTFGHHILGGTSIIQILPLVSSFFPWYATISEQAIPISFLIVDHSLPSISFCKNPLLVSSMSVSTSFSNHEASMIAALKASVCTTNTLPISVISFGLTKSCHLKLTAVGSPEFAPS